WALLRKHMPNAGVPNRRLAWGARSRGDEARGGASVLARERVQTVRIYRLAGQALGVAAGIVAGQTAEGQARLAAREQQRQSSKHQEPVEHCRSFQGRPKPSHESETTRSLPEFRARKKVGPARGGTPARRPVTFGEAR